MGIMSVGVPSGYFVRRGTLWVFCPSRYVVGINCVLLSA